MEFIKQRLYLYGRKQFAIYDLYGKVLDEYQLSLQSELSMIVNNTLVTFGTFGVVFQSINAQKQAL